MTGFTKILVANRGEIALRVLKTAKAMGYETVAVYSEADHDAPHVSFADQAVCIGPAQVNKSYLNMQAIVDACKQTGANAVHPGYGFLSENTQFCDLCQSNGISFIGPNPHAIELMGNKRLAKIEMLKAGVPCIPGYEGADQADDALLQAANEMGYPIMIKAAAGGGGRGMRLVERQSEFSAQLKTAKSEALNGFGSDEVILEKAVIEPRHIEIQVFADQHGNCIYLGERDCSVQRRHQKVVEEAPSPFVSEELRKKMGEAAVNAAKACDYVGAGTVEFLVDKSGEFYFLEMNTRLQVEHPVTELTTGIDLVEWQIQVAEGQALPMSQDQVQITGHAMEVRLYAEDTGNNFMPQTGQVHELTFPQLNGLRVDSGIKQGQMITPFYDPMLAKVICYGDNREQARRRLVSALSNMRLLGVKTNRGFLRNILEHSVFSSGEATTAFITQDFKNDISMEPASLSQFEKCLSGWLFYLQQAFEQSEERRFWRNSNPAPTWITTRSGEQECAVGVHVINARSQEFMLQVDDDQYHCKLITFNEAHITFDLEGVQNHKQFVFDSNNSLYLETLSGSECIENITHCLRQGAHRAGDGNIKASMDGAIVDVQVKEGDEVDVGKPLVVLEAMKMEHTMKADCKGRISKVHISVGDQVKGRQVLVEIELDEKEEAA